MIWRVRELTITNSTNDDVRKAAIAGEGEGLVIIAKKQTSGRGRQSRVWESPEGNLYLSILLRPPHLQLCAGFYSFVASLSVRDVIAALLPQAMIELKWPNDVLVQGKKISGILLEVEGDALIIGIGLNILHYPENPLYPVTSLSAEMVADSPPSVPPASVREALTVTSVLDMLLPRIAHWHNALQEKGFEPVRQAWLAHAKKGPLTVRLPRENLQGIFAGLDREGHLRLLLATGEERAIPTGEIIVPTGT